MDYLELFPDCVVDGISRTDSAVVIFAHSSHQNGVCPDCGQRSQRVHGYYTRSPRDLPLGEQAVRLQLKVRRYYCLNSSCQRCTFTETLSELIAPYARRTHRLKRVHTAVGSFLGGEAGSRLLEKLQMPISADSILQGIRLQEPESHPTPRVLGVDDWAIKKGRCYGTILVDLERHQAIDLLPDRSAAALELWLKEHSGIEVIVRDRSLDYARGAKEGAPEAKQIADRWHLLHNAQEMFGRWLGSVYGRLGGLPAAVEVQQELEKLALHKPSMYRPTRAERASLNANREHRLAQFQKVKELYNSGMRLLTISKQLGMNRKTVRAYAYADSFPETSRRYYLPNSLDAHLDYMKKRHGEGLENASQLWREIQERGFPGKKWQVLRWMQFRRSGPSKHTPYQNAPKVEKVQRASTPAKLSLPSAKQLSWLLLQDSGTLSREGLLIRNYVLQDQQLVLVYEQLKAFRKMVFQRAPEHLDAWLEVCSQSEVSALQTFAEGLRQDYDAVKAARVPWSNGQTEGQVNKLKLIKRQMYGRAGFDLLRQRVLLAA